MRLTASNGGPARDDRRRRAEATARAAHLRLLLISEERFPRARAVLESDDGLAAAVLGLIESRLLTVHPTDRAEVEQVLLSLAFRLGAELRCCSGSDGRLLVYDDLLIRRVLAARGSGLAGAPTRTLEQALLGDPMEPPQQGVLDQGRTLLGDALRRSRPTRVRLHDRSPVLVYSTSGEPDLVRTCLVEHLATIEALGHQGVPVVVLDDAVDPAPMRRALAEVRERTSGPIIHLPERSDGAAPGAKAQLRQHLVAALGTKHGPSVAALAQECFGAGLTGSANLGFWLLGDRTTVWLDQDAHPRTTRVRDATWAVASGQGFDAQLEAVRRLDVLDDLSTSPRPDLVVEPVDILHSVDLALDCDPRLWTNRLASVGWPTREDAGYDRVRGEAGPLGPARICTFRSCGHRDYRARLLHELVMSGSLSDEATSACLRGRLPFYEVVERPALGAAVDASKSAFGTAIAFSPELPLRPPLMLSTSLRLIDFSVGALQRFVGDFTTAWSPLTLSHYREDQTNSGRGPLAAYVLNEDLAELVTLILHRVFLDCLDPPDGRLGRCAAQLRTLGERFEPDGSVTLALWASTTASAAQLAARPGAVSQRYAQALRATFLATGLAADRRRFHQEVTQTCRAELARYSGQLELSGLVQDVPPPAALTDLIPG